jgi:hypothetical protein
MKKTTLLYWILGISVGVLFSSCEVDNYAAPDGILTGSVIDDITGKGLITEQPNGFRIRFEEFSWSNTPQPEHFWGKADGTFQNTKIFAGTYRITPVEGPFVQPNSQENVKIESGKATHLEFRVTPFVSFRDVNISKYGTGDSVKVTFTLIKNVASTTIDEYRIFASDKTPMVGVNAFDSKLSAIDGTKASQVLTEADLGTPITTTVKGYTSGKYYIRVGAKCKESTSSRYNMTEIFEVQF